MEQIETKASADLRALLCSEKEWVRVHVAEFLIWEHLCADEVQSMFLEEEKQSGHLPKYRIGIWRVLAQAAVDEKDRRYWINKIMAAYQDSDGEDRLHAIETLAKLKVSVVGEIADSLEGSMGLYTLWNYAMGAKPRLEEVKAILVADLTNDRLSELEMRITSYIFRYLGSLSDNQFEKISRWMDGRSFNSSLRSSLLATLWISAPPNEDEAILHTLRKELLALRSQREALNHIMMALAVRGDISDIEVIRDLYKMLRDTNQPDYSSDLHATAAYMVLKASDK